MRLVLVALALLGLVGIWAYYAHLEPTLPDRIPVHFNASGLPDHTAPRSQLVTLPQIDSLLTLLLVGLSFGTVFLGRVAPGWVSVPGKEQFVTLPPDARARVMEPVGASFAWLALAEHALFFYLLWATGEVALQHRASISQAPLAGVFAVVVGSVVFLAAATKRAIAREVERVRANGAT